jgi:hypothetical protein
MIERECPFWHSHFIVVHDAEKKIKVTSQIFLADPTIFKYNKTYYLYGSGGKDGF